MNPAYFKIQEEHLKLLQRMYVNYNDWCEFGAPEIDPKRPYGNSGSFIYADIAEAIGMKKDNDSEFSKEQIMHMDKLHKETAIALQICLFRQKFETGTFYKPKFYNDRIWEKKEATND